MLFYKRKVILSGFKKIISCVIKGKEALHCVEGACQHGGGIAEKIEKKLPAKIINRFFLGVSPTLRMTGNISQIDLFRSDAFMISAAHTDIKSGKISAEKALFRR
jgi:hypothetical protein